MSAAKEKEEGGDGTGEYKEEEEEGITEYVVTLTSSDPSAKSKTFDISSSPKPFFSRSNGYYSMTTDTKNTSITNTNNITYNGTAFATPYSTNCNIPPLSSEEETLCLSESYPVSIAVQNIEIFCSAPSDNTIEIEAQLNLSIPSSLISQITVNFISDPSSISGNNSNTNTFFSLGLPFSYNTETYINMYSSSQDFKQNNPSFSISYPSYVNLSKPFLSLLFPTKNASTNPFIVPIQYPENFSSTFVSEGGVIDCASDIGSVSYLTISSSSSTNLSSSSSRTQVNAKAIVIIIFTSLALLLLILVPIIIYNKEIRSNFQLKNLLKTGYFFNTLFVFILLGSLVYMYIKIIQILYQFVYL